MNRKRVLLCCFKERHIKKKKNSKNKVSVKINVKGKSCNIIVQNNRNKVSTGAVESAINVSILLMCKFILVPVTKEKHNKDSLFKNIYLFRI